MLGARLGQRPAAGPGADPVFLFGEEFDLTNVTDEQFARPVLKAAWQAMTGSGVDNDRNGESESKASEAAVERASTPQSTAELHELTEQSLFLAKFRDIVWLTYRNGFHPMQPPSSFTADTGWGCMLRSAQMLLAQVLVRHLGSSDWGQRNPASPAHRRLLRWFMDAPKYFAFYSIHRMTECGRQYGKRPGEWYGPNTVALVLRDLVAAHCQRGTAPQDKACLGVDSDLAQGAAARGDSYSLKARDKDIAVLVTDDSATLFLDEVASLCSPAPGNSAVVADSVDDSKAGQYDPLLRPLPEVAWSSALFVIVPLRLGLSELNAEYVPPLLEALKFPQCVGMIGGRPAHSLYFVGSQGRDFVYLDPHTVQAAATDEQCVDECFPYQEDVETYHCRVPYTIPAARVDPSLAVGFYCRDSAELRDLVARLGQLDRVGTPFMSVMQTRPKYDFDDDDEDDDEGDGFDSRSTTNDEERACAGATADEGVATRCTEPGLLPRVSTDENEDEDEFFDANEVIDEASIPTREEFVFL